MAWNLIQNTVSGGTTSPQTNTFSSTAIAGNLLTLFVNSRIGTTTTPSGWNHIAGLQSPTYNDFYWKIAAGTETNVVVTNTNATSGFVTLFEEWAGNNNAPLDTSVVSSTVIASSGTTATGLPITTGVLEGSSNALVLAGLYFLGAITSYTSMGGGFTQDNSIHNSSASIVVGHRSGVAPSTTVTPTWTTSTSANNQAVIEVAFTSSFSVANLLISSTAVSRAAFR